MDIDAKNVDEIAQFHPEQRRPDPGLVCLAALLRYHGLPADPTTLAHQLGAGDDQATRDDLVRLARRQGLKARAVEGRGWTQLAKAPLPAIVRRADGDGFVILAKIAEDKALIQDGRTMRPEAISRQDFDVLWDGSLILLTRRASLGDFSHKFGIGWFVAAMHKYRRLLGEVLVASFFLQLFGLVTPLFFQVVIDKVLVHRGLSTLDVLIIGLLLVSVFESALGMLRTYVFSHTTNRIDVELGARLFRHLLSLPMAYFGARRVGDTVARVRELENIRNFLTGSALTLVIDLFFTFVFLGVMAWYSMSADLVVVCRPCRSMSVLECRCTPLFRDAARREVPPRRREPGVPGRDRHRRRDAQSHGGRAADAAPLGGAARRLCHGLLPGVELSAITPARAIQFVSKLVTAAMLFFGAKAVIAGTMTVGELVAFNMLAQPRVAAGAAPRAALAGFPSGADLGRAAGRHPQRAARAAGDAGPRRAAADQGRDQLRACQLPLPARRAGDPAAASILTIAAGQVIGIVGPSGSGKSTLAKLLQRLYVPESGRVLVDGVDLAMVDPAWLRRQIGVVLQENVLFNRSVRENIALADPGMPMEQVIEAAKLAGAHEFILAAAARATTRMVGERGATLSGGQRQRIAIARALVDQSAHPDLRRSDQRARL